MSQSSSPSSSQSATSVQATPTQRYRLPDLEGTTLQDLGHWARLLWPVVLVVGGGAVFFKDAIVGTIVSTPHPALVYSIFGVCIIAVIAAMAVLQRYLQESKYAKRWMHLTPPMRDQALKTESSRSVFMPVYQLLAGKNNFSPESRQAAVSAELESGEVALEHRLELPNFLGGALVGMGLIGTFVGLLDTLDDLSQVFSALVNSGGSTLSPTQMFTDMVTKLQAPMQGMGTAFVASLYGLLGSLIVTLMMVSVRKTAAASVRHIHIAVRQLGYGAEATAGAGAVQVPQMYPAANNGEILRLIQVSQGMVEDLSRQIMQQQANQDQMAKQNSLLIQQLAAAGQATIASQQRTEEAVQTKLAQIRTAIQQDHDGKSAHSLLARQDTQQLVQSLDQCRESFERVATSMRTLTPKK
jgi:hypothetical protein